MTARRTPPDPPDRDPVPSDAESEAIGRRIRELSQSVEAPPALRARIAEAESARPSRARARGRRGRPRFALPAVAAAGLAAVVAAVLVLSGVVGGGGGAGAPSVDDAVALALARPTAAAPAVDAGDEHRVRASVGGVAFPNYGYQWPAWRAAGVRHDRLAGRGATTVVYRGPQGDVGYTIVDGTPLPEPDGARVVTADGVRVAVLRRGDATVVTWRRGGHTCVLAGRGAGIEGRLVSFAAWA